MWPYWTVIELYIGKSIEWMLDMRARRGLVELQMHMSLGQTSLYIIYCAYTRVGLYTNVTYVKEYCCTTWLLTHLPQTQGEHIESLTGMKKRRMVWTSWKSWRSIARCMYSKESIQARWWWQTKWWSISICWSYHQIPDCLQFNWHSLQLDY